MLFEVLSASQEEQRHPQLQEQLQLGSEVYAMMLSISAFDN
jgi:hypothetical protein